ncbi:MAG: type IVB secretion system protein IcmV [Tatlockia sp.]|jgi:intracellular multiplication protein IcmV
MKKNKTARITNVIGRVFNVRAWIDFDRMRSFTSYLANGFQRMFVPQQGPKEQSETFDEAAGRLNLSEKDIKSKQSALFRLSILMCLAALFMFGYALYHVVYGSYRASLISLVLMLIALALAFRYHFWYFQIKERKLGCTVQQWYKGLVGEK